MNGSCAARRRWPVKATRPRHKAAPLRDPAARHFAAVDDLLTATGHIEQQGATVRIDARAGAEERFAARVDHDLAAGRDLRRGPASRVEVAREECLVARLEAGQESIKQGCA